MDFENAYPTVSNNETEFRNSEARMFKTHKASTKLCAFNPHMRNVLATGSLDATVRLWTLLGSEEPTMRNKTFERGCNVLEHSQNCAQVPVEEGVTAMQWNSTGSLLATGTNDGHVRVFNREGKQLVSVHSHSGEVKSVKWNERSDSLISGGNDNYSCTWNLMNRQLSTKRHYFHEFFVTDVEWIDNTTFATCGNDQAVHIGTIDRAHPIRSYHGCHGADVNDIEWDAYSNKLASCGDDYKIKIIDIREPAPIFQFTEHEREVCQIKWSPIGGELASASWDYTVRIFDVIVGFCARTFKKHNAQVRSVDYSPDGRLIASGGIDGSVYIWDVKSSELVKSFSGKRVDQFCQVSWNTTGERLAASANDGTVVVFDTRMMVGNNNHVDEEEPMLIDDGPIGIYSQH